MGKSENVGGSNARRRPRRLGAPLWLALIALMLTGVGTLVFLIQRANTPDGMVQAERMSHDFGQVRMNGGLLRTTFPLSVTGPVRVTDLGTT